MTNARQMVVVSKNRLHKTQEVQRVVLFNEDDTPFTASPAVTTFIFGGGIAGAEVSDHRQIIVAPDNNTLEASLVTPRVIVSNSGSLFSTGGCEIDNIPIREFGWVLTYELFISNFVLDGSGQDYIRLRFTKSIPPGETYGEIDWGTPGEINDIADPTALRYEDMNVFTSEDGAQYSGIINVRLSLND